MAKHEELIEILSIKVGALEDAAREALKLFKNEKEGYWDFGMYGNALGQINVVRIHRVTKQLEEALDQVHSCDLCQVLK